MRTLLFVTFIAFVSGCATKLDGIRYEDDPYPFDLFAFFDGNVKAWGIVQNRSGEVVQRFTVDIEGRVEGDLLQLAESFNYLQGNGVNRRVWQISRLSDEQYTGGASDIPAGATGTAHGGAFRWKYTMDLPVGDKIYNVTFDDWIFSMGPNQLINRSWIQKFGVDVAEVTLFMAK